MGVQNLWDLLSPVGRRVSVETLAGKRLAIDASIWMIQFMKAMRDERGEMVRNAHLLGFFRRICKLLFLRTKPVFVFDGGTPALKRRTVIARRRQRENAQAKVRKTAEKLLLNELKKKRLHELAKELEEQRMKTHGKGKNVALSEAGPAEKNDGCVGSLNQEKIDEMLAASLAAEEHDLHNAGASSSYDALHGQDGGPSTSAFAKFMDDVEDEDDEEMIIPMTNGNIDPTVLAALPPSMQLDLLAQMRERLMAENRQKYQKVKKIETYLKTVAFRREIDEVQKAASGKGLGGLQTARIASEANKEFIFSSSFTGDKDALASAGTKKTSEDQDVAGLECSSTLPTTLASGLTPSIVSEPSGNEAPALSGNWAPASSGNEAPASSGNEAPALSGNQAPASSGNETRKSYDSNIQTYRDERGHMRVSRVRAMGIRMTRDLQRNLDLMKEMEQDMVSVDVPANVHVNPIKKDVGNNKIIWENLSEVSSEKCSTTEKHDNNRPVTNIGTSLEISFEDDGQCIPVDNDDDFFAHLVAGDPVPISSAGHFVSQDYTLESDSDCEWEEGNVGIQNEQFKSAAKKSQLEVDDDVTELQEEGGINRISMEASSYPAVSIKTKSRGSIEEESALQEAIARSLEDSKGDMDAANNLERGNTAIHLMSAAPPDQDNVIDVPKSASIDSSVSRTGLLHDMTKRKSSDILCPPDMIPMPSTSNTCQSLEMEVDKPCKNCSPLNAGCLVECGMSFSGETVKPQSNAAVRTTEKSHDVVLDVPGESSCGTLHSHVTDADFADPLHLITKKTSQTDGAAPQIRHFSEAPGISINHEKSKEPTSYVVGINRRASKEDLIHGVDERELSLGSIDNEKDDIQVEGANIEEEFRFLDEEYAYLEDEQRKLERNAASVNNEMFVECQELLQMFGIPYIIAPMEAEAQCAYMELSGLVEGVVTDDSDVFLFGARSVYKNIFDDRKYVETYLMKDIENELGLRREKLISLALLLGSDYTEGVSGIGIVNAIEVLNAFPEEDGLSKFREWVESPDPTILGISGMPCGSISKKRSKSSDTLMNVSKDGMDVISSDCDDHEKTKDKHELENIPKITQTFMDKHRNISKNWHIPSSFPSQAVISAYASPQVDKSTEPCAWGKPDQFALRRLCWEKFAWASQKADELLLPVLKEYNKRETQLRMEAFYTFNERFAKIRSKRIKQAVKGITGNQSLESSNNPKVGGQKNKRKTHTKEPIKSKTHEENFPSEKEQICLLEKETTATARGRQKAHAGGKRKRKGTNHIEFSDSDSKDDDQKLQSEKVEAPDRVRRSKRSRKAANYAESDDATKEEKPGNEEFVNDDSDCNGEMEQSTAADDGLCGDYLLKGSGLSADVEEPGNETCTLEGVKVDRQYLQSGGGFCFDDGDDSPENVGNVGLQRGSDSGTGTRSSNSFDSQQHQPTQNDTASGSPSQLGKGMSEIKDDTISPMKALSGMPYLRRKRKKSS